MATVPKSTRSTVITLGSDSAGPFDLDFRLFDDDAIIVFVDYEKVDPADYTLTSNYVDGFDDDATVTFDTAQTSGARIEIISDLSPHREDDYSDGPGLTGLLNIDLGRIAAAQLDMKRDIARSLKAFSESDPAEIPVGSVPERTATGWRAGPDTDDLTDAAANAATATAAATAAAASAAAAATYDPANHPLKANNLSDLGDIPTAVQNLGLDDAVTGTPGSDGQIAAWDSGGLDATYDVPDDDDLSNSGTGLALRSNVAAHVKFSLEYQSTGQTMIAGAQLVLAHGLGVKPKLIRLYAKCTTAEEGYSIGDDFDITAVMSRGRNASDDRTFAVVPDATNITVVNGNTSIFANTIHKSTGNSAALDRSNWDLYVEAWA